MLIFSRGKFNELCACSKYLFPVSPHWLTCMQNSMQIEPRLAGTFRRCPLEKTGTVLVTRYIPALDLECTLDTKPLIEEKKASISPGSRERQTEIKRSNTFTSVKKVDYLYNRSSTYHFIPSYLIWIKKEFLVCICGIYSFK